MHNNFFFLRHLSKQLKTELTGFRAGEIYTQQKNELTIRLYREENEFNIKAHLDTEFSCLYFPDSTSRAKKNSVDLFKDIYDLEILDIVQIDQDRSFYFILKKDYKLLFKLHGNRSNIILFHDEKVIEVFRNNLKNDFTLDLKTLPKSSDTSFENFKKQEGNYKTILPTFGKVFDKYFLEKRYSDLSIDKKYDVFNSLLSDLDNPEFYIEHEEDKKPTLLLFPTSNTEQVVKDPKTALNKLFKAYISDYRLQKEKSKRRNSILLQIKKCKSYINKTSEKLNKLKASQSYSNIGDLIMANLHLIKMHMQEIVLTDFFTQQPVTIKLKPTLTPQLNAEKYYKKAKSQKIEIDNLEKNIVAKKNQISEYLTKLEQLEGIKNLKELRKEQKSEISKPDPPFHKVSFMNFEILIGKNAKKNELLTFGLARKDDLFLHAKDSPGSHVIIRSKKNQNFPESLVEQAASFAAFYSKSKNENLIRVLYTPKKYVRKAKDSPPGTVIVSQEKIILVSPEAIKK